MMGDAEYRAIYQAHRAMPFGQRCSGADTCLLAVGHAGPHVGTRHIPMRLSSDPDRLGHDIVARALADAERAARAHRCAACWTPLWPYEVTPPGGPSLTITTCPVCDRWREGDDR